MLALSLSERFIGVALVVDGQPRLLFSRRLRPRTHDGAGIDRLAAWVERLLKLHRPAVVARLCVERRGPSSTARTEAVRDALDAVIARAGVLAVAVALAEVAEALGARPTLAAVRANMAQRHALVAGHLAATRGQRSESERHWEQAIAAAAAGEVLLRSLATPSALDTTPASAPPLAPRSPESTSPYAPQS